MKKYKLYRHSYSLMRIMKILTFGAVPIIIINLLIGILSFVNIRQQNLESISSSVSLYQEETASKIRSIEHFIQWSAVNEPLFDRMEEADNIGALNIPLAAFRTRVSDSQYATGTEYQYFMYLELCDFFFNASELHFTYQEYLSIKDYVLNQVSSGTSGKTNSSWQSVSLNGTTYLYYMITYQHRTFVTFINIADLIAPLNDINLGSGGSLTVTDLKKQNLYHSNPEANVKKYHSNSLFYNLLSFSGRDNALPFDVKLYIDNFNNYGKLMLLQYVLILTALSLCLVLAVFIICMYRKVIRPIHEFSTSLSNINEQEDLINLQSSNIQELEQTNLQFKNLIREIKKLKINIYENELSEKRFQIAFLQNQIRPHFYLNCLTTISSMAQLGKYKDIEDMVVFTSRYLRYLFQTDKETVRIKYELTHIQSYLDIQSLRYGPVFHYECRIQKLDEDAMIPPLLLITFIENIVKHSIAQDGQLQIELSVSLEIIEEKKMLFIHISDSGQGFSEDVLSKLSHGESLNTETQQHVGLTNNIQRLTLLYGSDYNLRFYNGSNGGAHISLYIPYQLWEDKE